jgi:phosphoglycolate phosphatase-like HAD superfamily hydrolase
VEAIEGAGKLLRSLSDFSRTGIATANLLSAAKVRLEAKSLWHPVSDLAFGAEGSGHKRETVARAIAATGLAKNRDVDAGLSNGVHFIGFSTDKARRAKLGAAGAKHLSGDHDTTSALIRDLLK